MSRKYFNPRVERAKKALAKAAEHAAKKLVDVIDVQAKAGDSKAIEWVLEHYEGPQGERVVATGVDKQKEIGQQGPQIAIGIGWNQPAPQLPDVGVKVIEAGIIEAEKLAPLPEAVVPSNSPGDTED